ncbi:MAG: hypothetical protein GWN77_02385 [Gammaproteobacteria bacterium]|nr:hypothetical protein [Gammaproteobacteria bacterium]
MAFLIDQAGGYASNGYQPILDVVPTVLHQRSPLFIGNRELVEPIEQFMLENREEN